MRKKTKAGKPTPAVDPKDALRAQRLQLLQQLKEVEGVANRLIGAIALLNDQIGDRAEAPQA